MTTQPNSLVRFFHDRHGHIIVLQWPNFLLSTWLVLKTLSVLMTNQATSDKVSQLASAVLLAWAYVELTSGVNYFRRAFGGSILAFVVIGYFI